MAENNDNDQEQLGIEPTSQTGVPVYLVLAAWVGKGIGALVFISVVLAVALVQLFSKLMEELGQLQQQNEQGNRRRRRRPRR